MAKMWRVTLDGEVSECDDTPDEDHTVVKYQRSAMRKGRWIYLHANGNNWWTREYVNDSEVPKRVKMMDLLDP